MVAARWSRPPGSRPAPRSRPRRRAREDGCAVVIGGGFHHAFAGPRRGLLPDQRRGDRDAGAARGGRGAAGWPSSTSTCTTATARRPILAGDPQLHGLAAPGAQLPCVQAAEPPRRRPARRHRRRRVPRRRSTTPLRRALASLPDLLFYLAGADPYEHDLLGGLGLTQRAWRARPAGLRGGAAGGRAGRGDARGRLRGAHRATP